MVEMQTMTRMEVYITYCGSAVDKLLRLQIWEHNERYLTQWSKTAKVDQSRVRKAVQYLLIWCLVQYCQKDCKKAQLY